MGFDDCVRYQRPGRSTATEIVNTLAQPEEHPVVERAELHTESAEIHSPLPLGDAFTLPVAESTGDPLLDRMGGLLRTHQDLLLYFVQRYEDRFGSYPWTPKRVKESVVTRTFVDTYGLERAYEIIRGLFDLYDGQWSGAPVGTEWLAKGWAPRHQEVWRKVSQGRVKRKASEIIAPTRPATALSEMLT